MEHAPVHVKAEFDSQVGKTGDFVGLVFIPTIW